MKTVARRWRIQPTTLAVISAATCAIDAADGAALSNATSVDNVTAIDPISLHPRVATYRNGYGTRFQCTSTCYFIMFAHLAAVALLLVLLFATPVQTPSDPEHAPFMLWFGDKHPDPNYAPASPTCTHQSGLIDRVSMWIYGHHESEPPQAEEPSESFHEDIDLVTEEGKPPRNFPSIVVDDSVIIDDAGSLSDAVPPEKKPGIFAPATPRGGGKATDRLLDDDSASPDVVPSPRGRGSASAGGRRFTFIGSASSDVSRGGLIAAIERRNAMEKRAEKRKEYAKSDIIHDNLHEPDLHMYKYLEFVRSLLEGISIKKITQKSGKVVKRTLFITPSLSTVYWNQVGNKAWVTKKSSIEATEIDRVIEGAEVSASSKSKSNLCLSVIMKGGKRLMLEAKDEAQRQRFVLGFSRLATEKREEKRKKDVGEVGSAEQAVNEGDDEEKSPAERFEAGAQDEESYHHQRGGSAEVERHGHSDEHELKH